MVATVLAILGTLLYQATSGKYDDSFKLTVIANTIGEGLAPGADVKFHGMAIGSVKQLQSIGYNKQKMTVLLDPRQAKVLTADTIARFTSSNLFGTTEVELVSDGKGPPLRRDQTLIVRNDVQAASITELLREGQRLARILDTPELNHVIEVLRRHADLVEPATKAGLDLAKSMADSQAVAVSQSLSTLAPLLNGLNETIPALDLAPELLESMNFLIAPGGVDRTNLVMQQTGQLLGKTGQMVVRNDPWLIQLLSGIMNAAVPSAYAIGSLAPDYDRLSGLLDRTSNAFPAIDGQVRMRTEVILDPVPGAPSPGGRR
jgi:ABC-type transporter Mla subunit MlaD